MFQTYVIVGGIASGKSTLARELAKSFYFHRIITYTTRPQRFDEINGVDYHFVSENRFEALKAANFFAETTAYDMTFDIKVNLHDTKGKWFYGSAKEDYITPTKHCVVVLNPQTVINLVPQVNIVYLDFDLVTLVARAVRRGNDIDSIISRIKQDAPYLEKLIYCKPIDFHFTNDAMTAIEMAKILANHAFSIENGWFKPKTWHHDADRKLEDRK